MAYREYLYLIERKTVDEIKGMSKVELYNWGINNKLIPESTDIDDAMLLPDLGELIIELGVGYDKSIDLQRLGIELFTDDSALEILWDTNPKIVGKEGLLQVIKWQKEKVRSLFEYALFSTQEDRDKKFDERTPEQIRKEHLESMYSEWTSEYLSPLAVDLNNNNPSITRSNIFEYEIFEKVRLYKSIDWEKYTLLFFGW